MFVLIYCVNFFKKGGNCVPLHPSIVHFPIALLLTATVIEVINLFLKKEYLFKTSTILFVTGFVTGLVSFMTGDAAEEFAEQKWGEVIESTVELHENMALLSLILFGAISILKLFGQKLKINTKWIVTLVVILGIIGSSTLAYTGHLGGKMVYESEKLSNTNNYELPDRD